MSTPAWTDNAYAKFDTPENATEANGKFRDFVIKANASKTVDFDIVWDGITDDDPRVINFAVSSQKEANLDWQLSQISKFFQKQSGIEEINADVVVMGEGYNWTKGFDDPDEPDPAEDWDMETDFAPN